MAARKGHAYTNNYSTHSHGTIAVMVEAATTYALFDDTTPENLKAAYSYLKDHVNHSRVPTLAAFTDYVEHLKEVKKSHPVKMGHQKLIGHGKIHRSFGSSLRKSLRLNDSGLIGKIQSVDMSKTRSPFSDSREKH